ncbi:hypothetical protein E8E13_001209 [Curvularia kusanoi]|uniref:Uncharacterized protein n=1 Tax=Curvularia kusanoi TaxID=90978 RepID=A0A9P4TEJ4_CURKU|nr:hypothetical protein E8E13_001209 [Curvularia kusanoi]
MSVVRKAAADLPLRSVHLRIVPRPSNLSESREIFRVMQRFGELNTYYNLRYEYHNPADNIALAIYRSPEAAQRALNASPLRFSLDRETIPTDEAYQDDGYARTADAQHAQNPDNNASEMTAPPSLVHQHRSASQPAPAPSNTGTPFPFTPPAPAPTTKKWFQITVDRSRTVHQDVVQRQPLWKNFQPMKSMSQLDLADQVPHAGLSDVNKRPPNAHRTPNKILKSMGLWVERGMPSLRAFAREKEEGGR